MIGLVRAIIGGALLNFADACRAWVARLDERMADSCNGEEDAL